MAKLRTDYQDGEVILSDFMNKTNSEVNKNSEGMAQLQDDVKEIKSNSSKLKEDADTAKESAQKAQTSAAEASGYLKDIRDLIPTLPEPENMATQVLANTADLQRTAYIRVGSKTFNVF